MSDSYRGLGAWQKAMELVNDVYDATGTFPRTEIYGLTNQLRRATVSVPSNIAEGKGRLSKREYVQFLSRARGSILEVQTQLEIGRNLGFLSSERYAELEIRANEVGRMINGLISTTRRTIKDPLRAKS